MELSNKEKVRTSVTAGGAAAQTVTNSPTDGATTGEPQINEAEVGNGPEISDTEAAADAENAHQAEGAHTVDADSTDVSGTTYTILPNFELQDAQRPRLDIEASGLGLTPKEYTNRQPLRAAIRTTQALAATVAHKAEVDKNKSAHAKDMLHLRE